MTSPAKESPPMEADSLPLNIGDFSSFFVSHLKEESRRFLATNLTYFTRVKKEGLHEFDIELILALPAENREVIIQSDVHLFVRYYHFRDVISLEIDALKVICQSVKPFLALLDRDVLFREILKAKERNAIITHGCEIAGMIGNGVPWETFCNCVDVKKLLVGEVEAELDRYVISVLDDDYHRYIDGCHCYDGLRQSRLGRKFPYECTPLINRVIQIFNTSLNDSTNLQEKEISQCRTFPLKYLLMDHLPMPYRKRVFTVVASKIAQLEGFRGMTDRKKIVEMLQKSQSS